MTPPPRRVFRVRSCSAGPAGPALHAALIDEVATRRRGIIAAHDDQRVEVPFATIHALGAKAHVIVTTKRGPDGGMHTSLGAVMPEDLSRLMKALSACVTECWVCGRTDNTVYCGTCGIGAACTTCMPSHQASVLCTMLRVNVGSPAIPCPPPVPSAPTLLPFPVPKVM